MSAPGHEELNLLEHLRTQLPVLLVVLPMLTAPVCILLRKARPSWTVAMISTWISFGISWVLLGAVQDGPISYHLGHWPPPWGIELRVDAVNAFVLLVVTGISAIVLLAAPRSLIETMPKGYPHHTFYAAYLLCMTGLLGMTITGDAFNVFVFLEISSLSAYTLIAQGRNPRALTAAFRYLVMGTVGGTFLLLGIGLLYMSTGHLNMLFMAESLAQIGPNRTVLVALACVTVGVGIKLALFPLHAWLPDAYSFAPPMVTALLAATATKVAFYVLARFIFVIFGAELAFGQLHLDLVLRALALAGMFVASAVAIFQHDVKRLLAFSSVAQIGYMVLGLSFASQTGLTAGIVHLFNHALTKSALFLCMACIIYRVGGARLDDLRGLGRLMPLTSAAFVAGGLSLIGVPATAGFVSKWLLVSAALEQGFWPIAVLILFSSLLAVVYVWRVVEVLYFSERPAGAVPAREAPPSLLAATWLLTGGAIFFGLATSFSVGSASRAAQWLLQGGVQ